MVKNTKNGFFVISLDFELHWGVFDALELDTYKKNLLAVPEVIDRLLALSKKYKVKLTFATVGFLFAHSKTDILKFSPELKPGYTNSRLNPYALFNTLGEDEEEDPLHYAKSIIKKIGDSKHHEMGSHTYSHYNCYADGQNIGEFKSDIESAIEIAKSCEFDLKSIVFPKNQVVKEYLEICKDLGITSFRGNERSILYNETFGHIKAKFPLFRLLRIIDAYFNISGNHTYNLDELSNDRQPILNLPSSRFLRPYLSRFSFLEPLKIRRITKAMEYAARKNELYHIWWHPHNFGHNLNENFENLEKIFIKYAELREKFEFESITMTGLTEKLQHNLSD